MGEEPKYYDGEKAWSALNHSILPGRNTKYGQRLFPISYKNYIGSFGFSPTCTPNETPSENYFCIYIWRGFSINWCNSSLELYKFYIAFAQRIPQGAKLRIEPVSNHLVTPHQIIVQVQAA